MSYHSELDYICQNCGQSFLPFSSSMICPECDTEASEVSSIIQETLEALKWHGYDHPGAYAALSRGDSYILLASEVAGRVKQGVDPREEAQFHASQMNLRSEGLRSHLSKFLEEILPTIIEQKFKK
jgi:hypothetical protein